MTDTQLFFVTLAILYLAEGCYRLPVNDVVFRAAWPEHCRAGFPASALSSSKSALVFSNPLPPFGLLFYAPPEPGAATDAPLNLLSTRRPVRLTWLRYRRVAPLLRICCSLHFLVLFVALPIIWTFWGHQFILAWFALFICSTALVLIAAHRVHRTLFPAKPWWPVMLRLLTYPPAAIHASVSVPLESFAAHHPVVVASVICIPDEFAGLSSRFLRDLLYPIPTSPIAGEHTRAGLDPVYHENLLDSLKTFAERSGLPPDSLLSPPDRPSPIDHPYCPRCFTQYADNIRFCSDCPGVKLCLPQRRESSIHLGS